MTVKRINQPVAEAALVPQLMAENAVEYTAVSVVNWPEQYAYCPKVEVALAHNGEALLVHFRVEEATVRAVAEADHGRVWEDSCVEFFSAPNPADGIYYNCECNCAGQVLLCAGAGRHERERAPEEVMAQVKRWASLGREPFDERKEPTQWEVALILPKAIYFKHAVETLSGLRLKANLYKCGDLLETPHFLSLFPIATEQPDFHRPEFFDTLTLE